MLRKSLIALTAAAALAVSMGAAASTASAKVKLHFDFGGYGGGYDPYFDAGYDDDYGYGNVECFWKKKFVKVKVWDGYGNWHWEKVFKKVKVCHKVHY